MAIESPETITPTLIRRKAMDLLARREHSRRELEEKLAVKLALSKGNWATMSAVLDALVEDGLLSDKRFAESLVQSRLRRGYGPLRINQQLRERGIEGDLGETVLRNCSADWAQLAGIIVRKKFGDRPPGDVKDKARRSRFLRYRGFDAGQIASALKYRDEET
jgi:regulatory protein